MEVFAITIELTTPAESLDAAALLFQLHAQGATIDKSKIRRVGFRHPDGKVRPCSIPPAGYEVQEMHVSHFHSICGMISSGATLYIATWGGQPLPTMPSPFTDTGRQDRGELPPESLGWDGKNWVPRRYIID